MTRQSLEQRPLLSAARRWPLRRATVVMALVFVIGWSLVFALVSTIMAKPSPPVRSGLPADFTIAAGRTAHIHGRNHESGVIGWTIPVDRETYDAYVRALGVADAQLMAIELGKLTMRPWISVSDGLAVRIMQAEGEAVEVELLEGRNAGQRGWISSLDLDP